MSTVDHPIDGEQYKEDGKLAKKCSLKINVRFGNGKGDTAFTVFVIDPHFFRGKLMPNCTQLERISPIHYKGFDITKLEDDISYLNPSMTRRIKFLCEDFDFIFNELSTGSIANYSNNDPCVSFYLPDEKEGKAEVAYGKKAK